MAQIPFFLITGYLGSGKTTLLKNILYRHADGQKIAVVQNEFAASGVDGTELRNTGKKFKMLELNRGSIFCVCLFSDFRRSLVAMIDEYKPDAVVVEATGLADPIALAQLLETPDLKERIYLKHIWCLVDPCAYLRFVGRITQAVHQIRAADTILLNKSDLAGAAELAEAKKRLAELNPSARIEQTSHAATDLQNLFELRSGLLERNGELIPETPCARPRIETAVLRNGKAAARPDLEKFVGKYAPRAWRIKGYVKCREGAFSIQASFGKLETTKLPGYEGASELVVLGGKFDPAELRRDFELMFG